MKYYVEYKELHELILLANAIQIPESKKYKKTLIIYDWELSFDVILVYFELGLKNIICSNKLILDLLVGNHAKNREILTKTCRCTIINYSEIIKLLPYNEFCNRYGFTI